jgi:3-hydroxyacyl-[acyl-carrier-protein] dehydratase
MILRDEFYHVTKHGISNGLLQTTLRFDPAHRIFEGHFPGQPVVPGVCMMQIAKELVEAYVLSAYAPGPGRRTRLVRADSAKFLTIIDPRGTPTVHADIQTSPGEEGEINVVARFYNEATTYFKLTAVLKISG